MNFTKVRIFFLAPAKAGLQDLPTSLLEAMTMQLAVIVSDQPVFHELVVDGQNGLFVPLDDAEALAAQIKRLALDRKLTKRLGQQGQMDVQARFKRDNWSAMIGQIAKSAKQEVIN